ncbi:virulence factor SrfC family protein [Vineibacter terrae]|uniref:virulence factor SrfC family protein n=1 Tax=Vineibacter terrae TaxID=2586908 RepID=UPI002E31F356|nr:virulence factor SrfC family protein [Vineibacter terrae]HEX2890177.1 virulence factor SrfC family protein [Vineibacter terrae]
MEEVDLKLSRDCEAAATASAEAITWIRDVAPTAESIGQQASSLIAELQKVRNQSRKLARAAKRKMCVGVFGPSQAGKSYLVSILASREGRPLIARFDGKGYDFLREINPPGGRESTGLVTRLSTEASDGPAGYPVELRLLTQTDLVKILANSFFLDFDHQKAAFQRPTTDKIRERLGELRGLAKDKPVDGLDEDDVLDLIEYFDGYFKGMTQDFHVDFWREALHLAPRLAGPDRARLWSLLWYDFEPYTKLFNDLFAGLKKLGFAEEAHCQIDALVPRENSIIDVLILDRLGTDAGDTLKVRPKLPGAADSELPRSLVCALTAELRIAIEDKPWPFFDHTDLLDFPGARSRLKLEKLEDAGKGSDGKQNANPLRELLLRGKVAYLFQRFSAEREISAILLCIPDGVQEVRDLSPMMEGWVGATFGDTAPARARQKNGLFLVLTKMDREFEQKAGETELSGRWGARLNNSLLNNFRGDWPRNWDGKPFRNSFWLRNPTVKDERLMLYADGREVGIADTFAERCRLLRDAFVGNEIVKQHFADPAKAWDEAFRPNDGGLSYIVANLTPVCDPAIKRAQVRGQIDEQIRRLSDRLAGFHSGTDSDARQKKQVLVQQVLRGLGPCIKAQRFGELVNALQVDEEDLRGIYFRVATMKADGNGKHGKPGDRGGEAVGAGIDLGDIFGEVFGHDAALGLSDGGSSTLQDRAHRFASEALQHWMERLRRTSGDERALSHFIVDRQQFGWLVDELAVGANRLRIADGLAKDVRAVENNANAKWEDIAERQVRAAANVINRFVDWLGFERVAREHRPGLPPQAPTRRVFDDPPPFAENDPPPLGEEPLPIYNTFCADWMRAFLQLAMDNVGFEGGRDITPEQNDRLGTILRRAEQAKLAA